MYLLSDNYEENYYRRCIFRGQGDSEWELRFSIFRNNEHIKQINRVEDQLIKNFMKRVIGRQQFA